MSLGYTCCNYSVVTIHGPYIVIIIIIIIITFHPVTGHEGSERG